MENRVVMLQARFGRRRWTVYDDGETEWLTLCLPLAPGDLPVDRFSAYRITEIAPERIVISGCGETHILTPGASVTLSREVEGHEWSDGCVYDGNTYILTITWQ